MCGSAGRGGSSKCHNPNLRGDRNAGGAIAHFLFVDSLTGPPAATASVCASVLSVRRGWLVWVRVRVVTWCVLCCIVGVAWACIDRTRGQMPAEAWYPTPRRATCRMCPPGRYRMSCPRAASSVASSASQTDGEGARAPAPGSTVAWHTHLSRPRVPGPCPWIVCSDGYHYFCSPPASRLVVMVIVLSCASCEWW